TRIKVIAGAELTHVPPPLISDLTRKARELGAAYVVVHGETLAEPVAPGTNRAAIDAGVDILAHPGLITAEEVKSARDRGVRLEITTRKGHSLTNGHVARLGREIGAGLVLNTDTHAPGDLVTFDFARKVVLGAGLTEEDFDLMQAGALELIAGLPEPWSLTINK
ncbi:MAG: histidinol phosphate phosphatase domain-containing protein, partial [Pseudomonadota bacterium]